LLLPPGLKEKMKLTDAQRTELRPIEESFAKTSREYQTANQPRIDAAHWANRQSRIAKDTVQIQAARTQLQQVWAGLQPHRAAAVTKIKPLLTPDQLKVLEDPKNQWREHHGDEMNDPSANARTFPSAFEGEHMLLPSGLKEKMKLTDTQRTELKPIEDNFANTSQAYKTANQPRIDAANEANRQARVSKDTAQIQAARTQLQQVWAGLQPHRAAAVTKIKPLLTPDQLKVLEDPTNQWRENHADEANDPSAN